MKGAENKLKKNSINAIISLVIYPFDVMLSIGESDSELKHVLGKKEIEWDDILSYEGAGRCALLTNNTVVIRIYRMPITPDDWGTLSHEVFHAIDFILRSIGIKLNRWSCESYAYLIGYLTKEVYKVIKP